jgi:PAS domain S-box-containing protein
MQQFDIFDQIRESVVITNKDGIIIKTNKYFTDIFEYAEEEVKGQNVSILIPEPYKSYHNSYVRNYNTTGANNFINTLRNVMAVKKNKDVIPIELSISSMDDYLIAIIRYRNFLEIMSDGLFIVDNLGKILMVNKTVTELYQHEIKDLVGTVITKIIPNFKISDTNYSEKVDIIDKKLGVTNVDISYNIMQKNMILVIIKEIKIEKKQLQAAIKKANTADEAKTTFLANMSHEIRTPMNGIYGMLALLNDTKLDNIQKDYVTTCIKSSEALMSLLDDVLLFSKGKSGKIVLDKHSFILSEIIENIVCIMNSNISEEKSIDLVYYIDPEVPDYLMGDSSRLRQILLNLINNGIKFTQLGEVALEVSVHQCDPLILKFEVSDTGIGISKEHIEKLFIPFSQVDSSTTKMSQGTGLGLSICKELVSLFEGNIKVKSRLGRGSTFSFTAKFEKNEAIVITEESYERLEGKRILVIDDNAVNCLMLSTILKNYKCNVTTLRCGMQGINEVQLATLKNEPYDIIILDYHMPHIDGIQVANILYTKFAYEWNILMISSSTDQKKIFTESNIKHFLSKPIKKKYLLNILNKIIYIRDNCNEGNYNNARRNSSSSNESNDSNDSYGNSNNSGSGSGSGSGVCSAGGVVGTGGTAYDEKRIFRKKSKVIIEEENSRLLDMRPKILVVEDNQVNNQVLTNMLTKLKYKAYSVTNGLEAIELLEEFKAKFNLIIMDIHMPVMDGLQATKIIRNKNINIPIIALTADISTELKETCYQLGFNSYLTKPVNFNTLKKEIGNFLCNNITESATKETNTKIIKRANTPYIMEVLLVDDMLINRKILQENLIKFDIFSHTVNNGQEAINFLLTTSHNPQIIFMDQYMPVMNGIDAANELHLLDIKIPIIGVSADDDCLFEHRINKQIKKEELKTVINEHKQNLNEKYTINLLFNPKLINDITIDDTQLKEELFVEYDNNFTDITNKITDLVAKEEYDNIKTLAHTLKGASIQLGFELFGHLCLKIEDCVLTKNVNDIKIYLNLLLKYYQVFLQNKEKLV